MQNAAKLLSFSGNTPFPLPSLPQCIQRLDVLSGFQSTVTWQPCLQLDMQLGRYDLAAVRRAFWSGIDWTGVGTGSAVLTTSGYITDQCVSQSLDWLFSWVPTHIYLHCFSVNSSSCSSGLPLKFHFRHYWRLCTYILLVFCHMDIIFTAIHCSLNHPTEYLIFGTFSNWVELGHRSEVDPVPYLGWTLVMV